ncbi:MAG: DUF7594 domain-containing protein [Solirubrobacteraceae bacterium]
MLARLRRRRRVAEAVAVAAVFAVVIVLVPTAEGLPDDMADETWGTNGRVNAIVQVGNVVFLGGSFTEVREDGGAGPGVLARNNIAAFDATTGAPIDGWDPNLNGPVYALAASSDGRQIYVGGSFTTVDGHSRSQLVALDAATGTASATWRPPSPKGSVRALAVAGNRLYAGGGFKAVDTETRLRLAAFDATTAALDATWQPAADAVVRALAISGDGKQVFAGGDFVTVSGLTRENVAALDAASGAVDPDWDPDPDHRIFSLATNDTTVFAAAGGSGNSVYAWDASTGSRRWRKRSDGDFQALAVARGIVYAGGHFNKFEGELRRKMVALDAGTGALRRDWRPKLPHASGTWGGVWAVSTYRDTRLAIGGDFDSISGFTQQGFAQFTGSIGGALSDTTPPTTPTGLTATAMGGSVVELAWSASVDDDGVAEYRILRDGAQVATSGISRYWDDAVEPSTTYSYRVVAVDFAGNASAASTSVTTTTAPPDEVKTFVATEDTYIDADRPTSNYGYATSLAIDASPRRDLLLKFAPSGISGRRILSAKLRLYNVGSSNDGGDYRRVPDSSWSEGSVTWNTAPEAESAIVAALDDVARDKWYELDVTPLVRGDGAVSVRGSTTSSDGADWSSTEGSGANRPQLVITLAADGADVPPAPIFSDGFETADASRWTEDSGLDFRHDDPFAGTWAARATSTGQATYAHQNLPVSEPELYYQLRFKVMSRSSSVTLLRFKTGSGRHIARLRLSSSGKLGTRNDVTGASTTSSTAVAAGRWHTAQMRVLVDDTAGEVDVWLDGVKIDALSTVESFGTTAIGRIQLGEDGTGGSYDLLFDEAVADRHPIDTQVTDDDTGTPSAPTLTATAISFDRVDLTWTASTDDVGVTGYGVYRDGVLLETVDGATRAYRDTSVASSTGYDYAVRAVDSAGNASEPSPTASVTTPARTIFLDGFESGDLSQWTGGSGLVVEQGHSFAGTFAARGTTTGAARYSYRELGTGYRELSYGLRFNVVSQSDSFALLKLRTASNSGVARLWLTSSGKLSTRNDVTGVSKSSSTAIAKGRWYTARMRVLVNGTASRIDVWLDGAEVGELSRTESLGTTAIGRVQLGDEATGKTYDVIFDEVAVDAPPANTTAPTVSGTAQAGRTLAADPGSWSGTEPIAYAYQWRRCDSAGDGCVDIAGETGQAYALTAADVGSTIRVRVTAANAVGQSSATSAPTAAVLPS